MKLFYLVNSLELNSIFTTESISPNEIIKKRKFSSRKPQNNIFNDFDKYLLFFEEIPIYENVGNDVSFAFKTILEFDLDTNLLSNISKGIWCTSRTILLSPENLKNIYVSDDNFESMGKGIGLKQVKSAFERSKYTKSNYRYDNLFKTFNVSFKEKKYSIEKFNVPLEHENKVILTDSIIDSVKGANYAYLIESIENKSNEERTLLQGIEIIRNEFAVIKNKIAQNIKSNSLSQLLTDFNKNVGYYKNIHEKLFPVGKGYDNISFEKKMSSDIDLPIDLLKKVLHFFLGKNADDYYKKRLNEFIKEEIKNYAEAYCLVLYDEILVLSKEYIKNVNTKKNQEIIADDFSDILIELDKYTSQLVLEKNANNSEGLDLDFLSLDVKTVKLNFNFENFDKDQFKLFQCICNELLEHKINYDIPSNINFNYFKQNNIVLNIGLNTFKKEDKSDFNEAYREIYRYIADSKVNYDVEKYSNYPIQQNFAAFIFNPTDIRLLQNYLESKNIKKGWISFLFWGIFNGFSQIEKEFVRRVYENQNLSEEINKIDVKLLNYQSELLNILTEKKFEKKNISKNEVLGTENPLYVKLKKVFDLIVDEAKFHIKTEIKNYFSVEKVEKLYKSLDERKDFISEVTYPEHINEILSENGISKQTNIYKLIIKEKLKSL